MERLDISDVEPDEIAKACERICAPLASLIPYDRIGVALLEEEGAVLRLRWRRSKLPVDSLPVNYSAAINRGSLAELLATGQTRVINDLRAYLRENPGSDSTRRLVNDGYRSSLACVLRGGARAIGVVFFSSLRPFAYQNEHEQIYALVAGVLGSSFERAWLGEKLHRFEAKEHFFDRIVQDLRNPLAVIRGCAGTLLSLGAEADSPCSRSCESIIEQADNMQRLLTDIERIRDLENPEFAVEKQPVSVSGLLQTVDQGAQILARSKDIRFSVESLVPPEEKIDADPQRLMQVFGNLIANAVKYSAPRTGILFSVDHTPSEIVFSVEDHGSGIPRAMLSTLFGEGPARPRSLPTLFERSSGLGLSVCRKIVESHGGRIWAESDYGRGSVFHVAIPRSELSR